VGVCVTLLFRFVSTSRTTGSSFRPLRVVGVTTLSVYETETSYE
jgi:hypothetical protein